MKFSSFIPFLDICTCLSILLVCCLLGFLTSHFKLQGMQEKIVYIIKLFVTKSHVCKLFPVKVQVVVENLNIQNMLHFS